MSRPFNSAVLPQARKLPWLPTASAAQGRATTPSLEALPEGSEEVGLLGALHCGPLGCVSQATRNTECSAAHPGKLLPLLARGKRPRRSDMPYDRRTPQPGLPALLGSTAQSCMLPTTSAAAAPTLRSHVDAPSMLVPATAAGAAFTVLGACILASGPP